MLLYLEVNNNMREHTVPLEVAPDLNLAECGRAHQSGSAAKWHSVANKQSVESIVTSEDWMINPLNSLLMFPFDF